jgi:hypothetical protein
MRPGTFPFRDCPFCKWPTLPTLQDHMKTAHQSHRFYDQKVPYTAIQCPLCDWPNEQESIQRRSQFSGANWTESDESQLERNSVEQRRLSSHREGGKMALQSNESNKRRKIGGDITKSVDSSRDPDVEQDDELEPIDVLSHVAEHLLAFSLKVLCWAGDKEDDSASKDVNSAGTAPSYQKFLDGPIPQFEENPTPLNGPMIPLTPPAVPKIDCNTERIISDSEHVNRGIATGGYGGGMMRIAIAGSGGLARIIAHYLNATVHPFIILSRQVSTAHGLWVIKLTL